METAPDVTLEWEIDDCLGQLRGVLQSLSDHLSEAVKEVLREFIKIYLGRKSPM